MAKRVTLRNFAGIKAGENNFYINLLPNDDANVLESATKLNKKVQEGDANTANLDLLVDMTLATKES